MTKGDLEEVVTSHIKGNSKASPSKGKGLVKGRGGGKKSSASKEARFSPLATSTTADLFLNPVLKQSNLLASLKDAFSESKNLELAEEKRGLKVEVTHDPFTAGRLFNLLQAANAEDEDFCEKLEKELSKLEFLEKNNDLYQFHQTRDLLLWPDSDNQPYLNAFKSILRGEIKDMVEEMTGISLNDNIDLFCGKYSRTDYLLCHDDELEGRRIAFIFYLVPVNWSDKDGGALDLFDINHAGEPCSVVKSLLPVRNSFAFFPVSEKSYHQVAEVLSKDNIRLSLSGWFHADSPAPRPPRFPTPLPRAFPWIPSSSNPDPSSTSSSPSLIAEWISPMYLDANLAKTVNRKFGKKSEIQLENFLRSDKLDAVLMELKKSCVWIATGPANKFHVHHASPSADTPELDKLITVFRSEEMFFLLSHFTGLRIHPAMEDGEDGEEEGDSDLEAEEQEEEEDEEEESNPKSADSVAIPSVGKGNAKSDEDDDDDDSPPAKKIRIADPDVVNQKIQPAVETRQENAAGKHSSNDDSDLDPPSCSVQILRWRPGDYSLLGDMSSTPSLSGESLRSLLSGSELDVSLCIGVDDRWNSLRHGGASVYVAKDEEDELLSVSPRHNALSLVFREKDTASFVKYINSDAPGLFYQIACGFKEVAMDVEIEEEGEEIEEEEDD